MAQLSYHFEYDLDDPRRTLAHREIIMRKSFLRKLYVSWYSELKGRLDQLPDGEILEIGSGGGFLKEELPQVITSDILELEHCDRCLSAEQLPFEDETLSAIFMVNVLHHIPDPTKFFAEAQRTLKKGGKIIMIEPANTLMSRFIYKNFHHEPFDEKAGWKLEGSGPMSDSNQALPWIMLHRDKAKFDQEFPQLKLESAKRHTAFAYVLSGGVSRPAMLPSGMFGFVRFVEKCLGPLNSIIGLFSTKVLVKE